MQECHFNSTSYNALNTVHGNHVNKEPSQSDVGAGSDTGIQIRAVTLLMPTLQHCNPCTHTCPYTYKAYGAGGKITKYGAIHTEPACNFYGERKNN